MISGPIKKHALDLISKERRLDGRDLLGFRDIEIQYDFSKNAEGSAKVRLGETEIIAGVKMSVDKPFPDTPDKGSLMVSAEFSQIANPKFEAGPPGGEAIELARVVDRGIRESKAVPPAKLCITEGEKVWTISIDLIPLNVAGNYLDAAGLASIAALKVARFPKYDGTSIDYKELTDDSVPLEKLPIPITVHKIVGKFVVDLTDSEEETSDCKLTVTTLEDGKICSVQKGGSQPLTSEDISNMIDISIKKGKELRSKL